MAANQLKIHIQTMLGELITDPSIIDGSDVQRHLLDSIDELRKLDSPGCDSVMGYILTSFEQLLGSESNVKVLKLLVTLMFNNLYHEPCYDVFVKFFKIPVEDLQIAVMESWSDTMIRQMTVQIPFINSICYSIFSTAVAGIASNNIFQHIFKVLYQFPDGELDWISTSKRFNLMHTHLPVVKQYCHANFVRDIVDDWMSKLGKIVAERFIKYVDSFESTLIPMAPSTLRCEIEESIVSLAANLKVALGCEDSLNLALLKYAPVGPEVDNVVRHHFGTIMDQVTQWLEGIAKSFDNDAYKYVYIVNNLRYIYIAVKEEGKESWVSKQDEDVVTYLEKYKKSWADMFYVINDALLIFRARVTDENKKILLEKLTDFNKRLKTTLRQQKGWQVYSKQDRVYMVMNVVRVVGDGYETLIKDCLKVGVHPDYTPDDVLSDIEEILSG